MAKKVFKNIEITPSTTKVAIEVPEIISRHDEQLSELSESTETFDTKKIDELKKASEEFEKTFLDKKNLMMQDAQTEADAIIEKAKNEAFDIIKNKNEEALIIKQKADDESKTIIEKSKIEAKNIESDIQNKESQIFN